MPMIEVDIKGRAGSFAVQAQFTAPPGVTSLFGVSGAGKSTVTRMIAGLLRPDEGRIAVDGEVLFDNVKGIDVSVRHRRIGHVFQDSRLFPHLSVKANLTFARWAGGRSEDRSLTEVVELLGIGHLLNRKPGKLSGGERQRVAIGRALLSAPRLLIMDEPLASLDQARKADILPYLDRLRSETGLPILYVSHAMEEVARLSQTLVILSAGKTLASGPVSSVLASLDPGTDLGGEETGTLLEGVVTHRDEQWDLSDVALDEGLVIQVPGLPASLGNRIRLRIPARDVSISLAKPSGISVRNILKAEVDALRPLDGAYLEAVCKVGAQMLRSRITRASAFELGLKPGQTVFLLIKSVTIDQGRVGPAVRES
ncbi:molybdenum ABC transporter ATP-binding protein [Roseibium litorale]|uniref:Molybdenum ABC transporter ATP-binding protein n=1 Tax=Roseibium litorale TaxID=2803841 RepID=A0ABR9CL38_9HYPH|nr:molybdenum ABC transporter ATP-binding protein [Roseibium litorale]MBD8891468.1 molybdenum ABC transporter ATP-binding protein [Roseibium litorale]